jgi:hypothetical protein
VAGALKLGAHGERVIAARFQLVVGLQQKAKQGIVDQGATEGWLHQELTPVKEPAEGPMEAAGVHFTLKQSLTEALVQDTQLSRGGRKRTQGKSSERLEASNILAVAGAMKPFKRFPARS